MSDRDTLLALELALARRDESSIPGGYEAVLDEAFAEFGASGRTWSRQATLEQLRMAQPSDAFDIEDFSASRIGAGVVLVTYTGVVRLPDGGLVRSRRSSTWVQGEDGGWRMRFHQGTVVPKG